MTGGARRRFELAIEGVAHTVTLERRHDGGVRLQWGGASFPYAAVGLGGARHDVSLADARYTFAVYREERNGEARVAVFGAAGQASVAEFDPIAAAAAQGGDEGTLEAPMPGKVLSFLVEPGEAVRRGQPLAVIEAMKMEHTISAPHDGVVDALLYAAGDQVAEGSELLRLTRRAQ